MIVTVIFRDGQRITLHGLSLEILGTLGSSSVAGYIINPSDQFQSLRTNRPSGTWKPEKE